MSHSNFASLDITLFNNYRHVIDKDNVIGVNITYNFASVLFDFALRARLVNKTDAKI